MRCIYVHSKTVAIASLMVQKQKYKEKPSSSEETVLAVVCAGSLGASR